LFSRRNAFAPGCDARVLYAPREAGFSFDMRAFAWFMAMFLIGFAVLAAFTYPVWLLHPEWRFHRVGGRLGQLTLLVSLLLLARRLGVADRASFGYGLPATTFMRELLKALVLGVVTMVPIVVVMSMLGLRVWKEGVAPDLEFLTKVAVKGLLTGLVVALIEETFLRGAMFTAIARESGARLAILLTSVVYAATHFFVSFRIPADQVTAYSGIDLVLGTVANFSDPLGLRDPENRIFDAFLCLAAVGLLLASVRAATGNIAACMGLHAGWVWVIAFVREGTSAADDSHPMRFLTSQFDGVVGWLVLAWTIVIGLVLHRLYARGRQGKVSLQPDG
jgi:membrane protease YdiL (CAAX protease family)